MGGGEPCYKPLPPCIGPEQAPGRKYSKQQGGSALTHPVSKSVLRTAFYGAYTEPRARLNTARKGRGSNYIATGGWHLFVGGQRALRGFPSSLFISL